MGGRELLRRYQVREGIRQADLARRLGVSAAAVSLWLRGLRTPDRAAALRIARVAGVPVDAW